MCAGLIRLIYYSDVSQRTVYICSYQLALNIFEELGMCIYFVSEGQRLITMQRITNALV